MSLLSKKGAFNATTSSTTQNVTGVGFQPKAILFWTGGELLTGTGFTPHQSMSMGCKTAAFQSETYAGFLDGSSSSTSTISYSPENNNWCIVIGTGDNVIRRASCTSLNADGFSLSWSSTPTAATLIHYLALGGTDITNATAGHYDCTGTGSNAITGIGFQPDCAIFLLSGSFGTSSTGLGMGVATSASKRWAWSINTQGGGASNWARSVLRTDRCMTMVNSSTLDVEADFTAFTSDGFTFNAITNPSGFTYVALLLKCGGRVDVGAFGKAAYAGATDTITPAFTTGGAISSVIQVSIGKTASTSLYDDSKISLGAADGTSSGSVWSGSINASNPSSAATRTSTASSVTIAHPSAVDGECSTTFTSTSFINNWATNDGTIEQIAWLAFSSGNLISGPVAASGKKGYFTGVGRSLWGTSALSSRKPVIRSSGTLPVIPVSGSVALTASKPTVIAGTFSPDQGAATWGEGAWGEFEWGGPDIYADAALVAAKPVVVALTAAASNAAAIASRKPVIVATLVEAFSASVSVTAAKPVIQGGTQQAVVSATGAAASQKPVINVTARELFSGAAAVTAAKPTYSASGVAGTSRVAIAGRRPVLAASGSVSLTLYTGTAHVTAQKASMAALRSLWNSTTAPLSQTATSSPLTVGVRFTTTAAGQIKGVRFFKPLGGTGTYTAVLYSASGAPLGQAQFNSSSASAGWMTVLFSNTILVSANKTYVAAVYSTSGWSSGLPTVTSGIVHQVSVGGYYYVTASGGSSPTFPTTGSSTSYAVDVAFVASPYGSSALNRPPYHLWSKARNGVAANTR